jgi:hypothetical protein
MASASAEQPDGPALIAQRDSQVRSVCVMCVRVIEGGREGG